MSLWALNISLDMIISLLLQALIARLLSSSVAVNAESYQNPCQLPQGRESLTGRDIKLFKYISKITYLVHKHMI